MTVASKCETCRKRKVKCDERRPTCSACQKKSRPCRYQAQTQMLNDDVGEQLVAIQVGKNSKTFVPTVSSPVSTGNHNRGEIDSEFFTLQYAQNADDSQGLYLTLGCPPNYQRKLRQNNALVLQSPSLADSIQCRETRLIKKWGSLFGYNSMDLNPLGEWLRLAWPAIGEDTAVTHACEFALSSMELFQLRTDASLGRAYTAGARAIESLQAAVRACSGPEQTRNLILAVSLHSAAEHFIKLGSFNYVPHLLGAAKLLKMYRTMRPTDDLLKMMARSTCMDEMIEAVLDHRESSIFEDAFQPPKDIRSIAPFDIDVSMEIVQYRLAQLPRLIFDTRSAIECIDKQNSHVVVVERIVALFNSEAGSYVERTIKEHSKVVNGAEASGAPPTKGSLEFDATQVFYMAVGYYFSQIIICSLMQRLEEVHPGGTTMLDIPAARAGDLAAATSLAMCIGYALKQTPSRPFTALAVLAPAQLSIGSWFRLQKRQPSTDTVEHLRAVEMVKWSTEKANCIVEMWQSAPASVERLTLISEMFAGGPYVSKRGLP